MSSVQLQTKTIEYLDIYDDKGNLLGIKESKKEAHNKGLWYKLLFEFLEK